VLLLVAGHETTVNLIANGVLNLTRHGLLKHAAVRPKQVVEEVLRYDPPVQLTSRQALVDVELGGVAPTPAAAIAVARDGLALAAVISASHNPWTDNGIKFFGSDGHKLTDEREAQIEARLNVVCQGRRGTITSSDAAARGYESALIARYGTFDLRGRRFALDCAHGAAFRTAPAVFRALGAEVTVIGDRPDGRNINAGVGSTHPEALLATVAEGGYDAGFAFDGDADRLLACDRHGRLLDGDDLLVLAAAHLKRVGRLAGNGVAVTLMSNYGVRAALAAAGIDQ
jgi:phosphoglucosamine mutase